MKFEAVDRLMDEAVVTGVFPGGVLLAARDGEIRHVSAVGRANILTGEKVTPETVFDLASLTKPLATTLAVMVVAAEGELDLAAPIGEWFPAAFRGPHGWLSHGEAGKARITVLDLLSHNAGFPAWKPYFKDLRRRPAHERPARLRELVARQPLIHEPGERTLYSDIGFMFLAHLVEDLTGESLERFTEDRIYRPLGAELFFNPLHSPRAGRYAATERCPWRGRVLEGLVHDDNAYAAGGVAGHAGLFGTVRGAYAVADHLLRCWHGTSEDSIAATAREPGPLAPEWVRRFLSPHVVHGRDTGRALGFDRPSARDSSAGRYFSSLSVGHLGFTGVSLWMDLARSVIILLLTNRVHPDRSNTRIRAFRPLIHDAS